jgi:hypothetical protein
MPFICKVSAAKSSTAATNKNTAEDKMIIVSFPYVIQTLIVCINRSSYNRTKNYRTVAKRKTEEPTMQLLRR